MPPIETERLERRRSERQGGGEFATRRRFIAVAATAMAVAALPRRSRAAPRLYEWRGVALGAQATIRLVHDDDRAARALLERSVAEIERLEAVFSLYRADSALSRLNRDGMLAAPPAELVELLDRATALGDATDGLFDPTIQPLWRRFAEHFAVPGANPAGPEIDDVLPLVDWRRVSVDAGRIAFGRPGMAVTLNGIAQGYITDQVAELLRAGGMTDLVLDLGETRALGAHPDGRPWRVGLADPHDSGKIAVRLPLRDLAIATSGGQGMPFEATGRRNHLIDPRTGRSAPPDRSVSVVARDATTADGAATALALATAETVPAMAARLGAVEVHLLGPDSYRVVA